MKTERSRIYFYATPRANEILYSGISFEEFIEHLQPPIENIILLKADYVGEKCFHNFELLEGSGDIENFTHEDIYNFGDFCFVDYAGDTVASLNKQQIAELLFVSHMFEPLNSPFFDVLGNRFVYLSHDDGYYCKLFCRDILDPIKVILCKIQSRMQDSIDISSDFSDGICGELQKIASNGILVDLDEITFVQNTASIPLVLNIH